jgi:hypothetical protein
LDQEYKYFVGIDWGTQNHRIVLLDGEGAIEQYDAHTGQGLRCLVDRLMCTTACAANMVAIAVETSWGWVGSGTRQVGGVNDQKKPRVVHNTRSSHIDSNMGEIRKNTPQPSVLDRFARAPVLNSARQLSDPPSNENRLDAYT